jgi:hypothetical protein
MNLEETFVKTSAATLIRPAGRRSLTSVARVLLQICAWIVLALAVILVYSRVWKDAPFLTSDTGRYVEAAADLADGSLDTYQARTPGLPLFLLLVGTGRTFFGASLVLHLAAVGLLLAVLRSAEVPVLLQILFALMALLPPFVQNSAFVMTEGLTEFLLVAGFTGLWFFVRGQSRVALLLGGLAFALATLTRPQNQFIPVLIGIVLVGCFGWKKGVASGMLLAAPSVILVGGYILHNYVKFGEPELTYFLGYHLGTRTVSVYEDIPDKEVRQIMIESRNHAIETGGNPLWTTWETRQRLMDVKHLSAVELAKYMKRVHLNLIRNHLNAYFLEVGRTFVYFWSPNMPSETNRLLLIKLLTFSVQAALSICFALCCIFAAGLFLGRLLLAIPEWIPSLGERFLYTILITIVFYLAATSCGLDWGDPRYRSVADLLILVVVILSTDYVLRLRKSRLLGGSRLVD